MTEENKCVECGKPAGQAKLCTACIAKLAEAAGYKIPEIKPEEKPAKKKHLSGVGKVEPKQELTEAEKVQVALMLREVNTIKASLVQTTEAMGELIRVIVQSRGLDDKKYGVNLAAGNIMLVEAPQVAEEAKKKARNDNGKKPQKGE